MVSVGIGYEMIHKPKVLIAVSQVRKLYRFFFNILRYLDHMCLLGLDYLITLNLL